MEDRHTQEPSTVSPLPTPQHILTTLLNVPLSNPPPLFDQTNSNPLKHLPASDRSLLATLHVLYPSLVLPALDLLDRGLVTRIIQTVPESSTLTKIPAQADIPFLETTAQNPRDSSTNSIFLVRSAQESKGKLASGARYGSSATGIKYTVRLEAWNCSCAAFTFSAFPGGLAGREFVLEENQSGSFEPGAAKIGWSFGGVSDNGRFGGNVPCCKHLLACVLGERWAAWLGSFVKERRLGRDEMAGIGDDG